MGLGARARGILSLAQDCPDAQTFRSAALGELARIAPADSAILTLSTSDPRPAQINKREFLPLMKLLSSDPERYLTGLAKGRVASARDGAYLDSEVYSSAERRELPFFRDILGPQRVTSQIVGGLWFRGQQTAMLHLCRHGAGTPYSRDDLERIRELLPLIALGQEAQSARVMAPRLWRSDEERDRSESLTERQQEIVKYVCRGFRNRDIALALGRSPNTVRNQLAQIFEKLHVESRAELTALIVKRDG